MALLEATLQQTYYGQNVINRWTYRSSGTPSSVLLSEALAFAMGYIFTTDPPAGTIAALLQDCQNLQVNYDLISVKDIYSETDFYELALPGTFNGQATGDSGAPYAAYGMRTSRRRRDIRRGTKRFVGTNDTDVQAGGVLSTDLIDNFLQPLADEMSATLTYTENGENLSFIPVVLGKDDYTAPSGKKAYRYYPTEAQQLLYVAEGFVWEVYDTVRTQVSRQYGHGR